MKRIATWLMLLTLLLAPCVLAVPANENALNLRIVYRVQAGALGSDEYVLYCNASAFPIARDEEATYLLTDAALYNFDTAIAASAEGISALFEDAGISGIRAEEYAAEFTVQSADIAIVYGGEVYTPTLVYSSDSYALLSLTDAPDIAIPAYTETLPTSSVYFYGTQTPGFGIASEEPLLAETLVRTDAALADASGTITAETAYTCENLGSPILDSTGTVCGIVCYDAASGTIYGAALSGLKEALSPLGITLDPIGGAREPAATVRHTTAAQTSSETAAVTTTARKSSETGTMTADLRTLIIYATCIAGALLILVIILLILRSRASRPDREVEQLRRDENRENLARPTAAARSVHASPAPVRPEPERAPLKEDLFAAPRYEAPRSAPAASSPSAPAADDGATRRIPKPASAAPSPAPAPAVPPRSVMLAVLDGSLQGYTLNIVGTVMLGRDPKVCQIVFGATQTEISRRHCQVTYKPDTGEIILEDLNSANGTYTPDGRRFAAGRRYLLRTGDRFCLGTRENMVEVR